MDKILLYRLILQDTFNLEYPVLVVRKSRIIWPGNISCWGLYEGEWIRAKLKHKISYNYRVDDETIFQTLAHEYCHAWQMEKELELEHDSPEFISWDNHFKTHWGFSLIL